jgi:hypothetical protein
MSDKLARIERYKSPAQNWVAGSLLEFRDVAETRGPRKGRMVIDRVLLHASLSLTVATATTQGEDIVRAFRTVTILEKDGALRCTEMPGDALRIVSFAVNGADRTHEHADFAAGGPTVVNMTLSVPLTKRYVYEGGDYALAVELLDAIKVRCADAAIMSLGTSVVTVNSGSYYVIIEAHEEMGIVQHVPDEWIVKPFDGAGAAGVLEKELTFTKGRLHDLYVYVPGANGGQTLANLSEIFVEHLMPRSLAKDPDQTTFFQRQRDIAQSGLSAKGAATTTSPFSGATVRACALILATGTKSYEGPERTKLNVRLTLTGALPAAPVMIARIIHPRSETTQNQLMRMYGKSGYYVKTADKTRREPSKWNPAHLPYLPIKFF